MCIIIALVIILAVQSACFINYKSSYKEEVSVLQTELDSLRKQNEELETKASVQEETLANYEQVLLEKDAQIQEFETCIETLEKEKAELEKALKAKLSASQATTSTTQNSGKYSQATQVWNGLKALGLNDYVCAGIMGNIMEGNGCFINSRRHLLMSLCVGESPEGVNCFCLVF